MYFSLVRKVRKGQKEEGIPLLNSFRIRDRVAGRSARQVSAGGGQSKIVKSVFPHGFLYATRANTSHEVAEQIRVCAGSTPA